jgi:hypothetical protein
MKLVTLSKTDQNAHLASHKVIINFADVAALGAGTTGTLQIVPEAGTFPAGMQFRFAALKLTTPFDSSDAGINSLLIEIGDSGNTARLMPQTQIHIDGTEIFNLVPTGGLAIAYNVADKVNATFTVAGGGTPTLAETTVGEVEIYLWIRDSAVVAKVR